MSLFVTTPPESEPVTVSELKAHLNIVHDEDNNYLKGIIIAARGYVETFIRRALITQTIEARFDRFGGWVIELERAPLDSVVSINYINTAGVLTLLDPADYVVDKYSTPGRVVPASGKSWPSTDSEAPNAVIVQYVAGYGTSRESVPQELKHGLLMQAAHFYENREPTAFGGIVTKIPATVEALIGPYRVW